MDGDRRALTDSSPPAAPGRRWARDNRILAAIALALGTALAGGYALVLRTRDLSPIAATNRVLLFVLFYIVVVLILALVFVLVRSTAKLVLESRRARSPRRAARTSARRSSAGGRSWAGRGA